MRLMVGWVCCWTSLWYALYGSTLESESSFEDRMSALARELGSRGRADAVVAHATPEPCPEPDEAGQGESAEASALRSALGKMKLSALRKRATAAKAEETDLEAAEDAEDPKAAMIALVVARETPTANDPAAELRAELESLKPSALRKRAKAAGAVDEDIEEAGDADDAKSAMVALILAQPGR